MDNHQEWAASFGGMGTEHLNPISVQQLTVQNVSLQSLVGWKTSQGGTQKFKPYSEQKLIELAENIKENGIMEPITVRPIAGGRLEIIAGHNRVAAAKMAGLTTIPAIVRPIDDNQAAIIHVDTNLKHREKLLPSELAYAYKTRLDAMSHQGKSTSSQFETKLRSDDELAKAVGQSRATVQRLIRLNYLIPELLDMVDSGKPGVSVGVELSYLPAETQMLVYQIMVDIKTTVNGVQAKQLRNAAADRELSHADIVNILLIEDEKKAIKKEFKFSLTPEMLNLMPVGATRKEIESIIMQAILLYNSEKRN